MMTTAEEIIESLIEAEIKIPLPAHDIKTKKIKGSAIKKGMIAVGSSDWREPGDDHYSSADVYFLITRVAKGKSHYVLHGHTDYAKRKLDGVWNLVFTSSEMKLANELQPTAKNTVDIVITK